MDGWLRSYSMKHNAIPPRIDREAGANVSRLKWSLCSVSICLGMILALRGDWYSGDTISYLDMGDRFFAGDHGAILNGLWSPLFPFLHGLTRWLVKPSMRWEPMVFQLTNLLIYITTVFSFQFFWGTALRLCRHLSEREGQIRFAILSDGEFWSFGYAIFLFMHLDLVTCGTPDMLLSTSVYLAAGLVLRAQLSGPTLRRFCLLGLLLGLGFLTKAVMLPLAGVFLAAAVLPRLRWPPVFSYALVSVFVFSAVASPYVFALSKKVRHFTTGEAGSLNYAWHVNGIPFVHWQGGRPQLGTPLHPTRKISSSPAIYEFATPVSGIYPPWDDPFYWNEGFHPRFDWADQLSTFKANLVRYLRGLEAQGVLIAGILVLLAMRQKDRKMLQECAAIWFVWAPALAAFAIYSAVWVEERYVAQFFVMLWAAVLTLVRLPEGSHNRRLIRSVSVVVLILMSMRIGAIFVRDAVSGHDNAETQMQIAEGVAEKGVQRGEKVAVIGAETGEGWQHLSRISIVAEIPYEEKNQFWAADQAERARICEILAKTGAVVLIAPEIPGWASTSGWERIGQASVYIYHLNR